MRKRARELALSVLRERLAGTLDLRFDLIGVASILADDGGRLLESLAPGAATDVRLRVAGRHAEAAVVDRVLRERDALDTCGPGGGGGVRTARRQRLSNRALLIPRASCCPRAMNSPEEPAMRDIPLHDIAHGRTGDKGDIVNISLIAYRPEDYPLLVEQVTTERVAAHFGHRTPARVQRFLLPKLDAMNFVLHEVLDGGVNDALNLDSHGKSLSFHLLAMRIQAG